MVRPWITPVAAALMMAALPALPAPLAAQRGQGRNAGDEYRSRIDTTIAFDRAGTVDLSLVSGEIVVTSWGRNAVRVHATSERGRLRLDASPSRIRLEVRSYRGGMGDTRYEVTIPAGARLLARSVSGNIHARGGGEVDAHSVSGDIVLSNASSRVTAESVSGSVRITGVRGGLRAGSTSGDLELSDITGDVDARTVSGDIELDGVRSAFVRTETVSGDTRFAGTLDPKGRYEFHSHSGDLRLILPPAGASVSAATFSGDVDSDYPMTLLPGTRAGGRQVEFTINGGGGARVVTETFSGDITIERASGPNREE